MILTLAEYNNRNKYSDTYEITIIIKKKLAKYHKPVKGTKIFGIFVKILVLGQK